MSYPVDIESVKNTKLFKKFMESKNKSISATGPRIQNVDINVRPITTPCFDQYPSPSLLPNQQPLHPGTSKPTYLRDQFTAKRNIQPTQAQIKRGSTLESHHALEMSQRKTQNNNKQRTVNQEGQQKKYEKLLEEYNQLKSKISAERKQNRKQMIKLEQQADLLSKKIFELRNREDELILQNKRLKDKSGVQQKQKLQMEQVNRQLQFQVEELKDMLNGQENSSKKRQDEASHWKKINDELKQRIRQLELEVTKLRDLNNMMQREKYVIEKEIANKQSHLNEMREKIHSMISENGNLRDEIFHLTGKLYSYQQENKQLKADLKRHSDSFPMSYFQEQIYQARSFRPQNPNQHQATQEMNKLEATENTQKRTERRRGQFARERGQKKTQNQSQVRVTQQPTLQQGHGQNKEVGQALKKLEQLSEQLQKLKDMKAMNGTMRRQKINLERQILELQEYLKNRQ